MCLDKIFRILRHKMAELLSNLMLANSYGTLHTVWDGVQL